jgi:hypothetical protein
MDVVNDDAKGDFRRVEILTGPSRRRRWSAEEKGRIVAEKLQPDAFYVRFPPYAADPAPPLTWSSSVSFSSIMISMRILHSAWLYIRG